MVAGGYPATESIEVMDTDELRLCKQLPHKNLPQMKGAIGALVGGLPLICGGIEINGQPNTINPFLVNTQ